MNILKVPYLSFIGYNDPISSVHEIFELYDGNELLNEPWPDGAVKPDANFNIAYGDDALFLRFLVREKYFKATYKQTNTPVFEDSCVEFFIGFDNEAGYYNFEFNPLGTILAGYGTGKERELIAAELVNQIKISAGYKKSATELPHQWELTIAIPFKLFCKKEVSTLKGLTCKANFYKCGDGLPEPHYLCWNNIIAAVPEFHLPQYFGQLIFE
jgi:hypothetical protein